MNISAFLSASDTPISEAAVKALIGFVVVLVVLLLLVGIFYLTGFLFQTKALSKDKLFERNKQKSKPVQDTAANSDEQTDEELFAVITAVISAIYDGEAQEGDVKPEFVIRRVKRK